MVEDVLIKIKNFIFPVDFIILEIEPVSNPEGHISVILGRPFLAIVNAKINCRNRLMKLSFENMTIELSVFNLEQESSKQASVNMIQDEPYDISIKKIDPKSHILLNHEYNKHSILKNYKFMVKEGIS